MNQTENLSLRRRLRIPSPTQPFGSRELARAFGDIQDDGKLKRE